MRTLVVAGEYYSENLGDGVITETLRYLLQQANPELDVKIIDISHRTEFCATPPSSIIRTTGRFSRTLAWLFKTCIPDNLKRTAVLYRLMWKFREQKAHQQYFMTELEDAAALPPIAEKVYHFAQAEGICNINLALCPKLPQELVELIAQYRAIISYRLHANIITTSLWIPSIGFIWDKKVRQFGNESSRSEYYLEPDKAEVEVIAKKLADMCSGKFPKNEIKRLKRAALENVRFTLQKLGMM